MDIHILSACTRPIQQLASPPPLLLASFVLSVIVRIKWELRTKPIHNKALRHYESLREALTAANKEYSMSQVHPLLPRLTVNRQFMNDFLSADTPCFALGLVEERKRQCGFLALRPDEIIPPDISNAGFRFGHTLYGNADFEVVHFAFEFYGFKTYNVLVNPNNPLVKAVLTTMIESGDYFFFELNSNGSATAFRSEIVQADLAGLKTNFPRIQRSTTSDAQYRKTVSSFEKNPEPPGVMLHWVCRDNVEYLDLTKDRLELTPA